MVKASKNVSSPVELPGVAHARMSVAEWEHEHKLTAHVPWDMERQNVFFAQVEHMCSRMQLLRLQLQSVADEPSDTFLTLLGYLDTVQGTALETEIRFCMREVENRETKKAAMSTYWIMKDLMLSFYLKVTDRQFTMAELPNAKVYQDSLKFLKTAIGAILAELSTLPPARHVFRISMKIEPEISKTMQLTELDTSFEIAFARPSLYSSNGADERSLIFERGGGLNMKLNSTAEDMSAELSKLLRSVEYGARFSKSHQEKTVERFEALLRLFSSENPIADPSVGRIWVHQQDKLGACTQTQRDGIYARLKAGIQAIKFAPSFVEETSPPFSGFPTSGFIIPETSPSKDRSTYLSKP